MTSMLTHCKLSRAAHAALLRTAAASVTPARSAAAVAGPRALSTSRHPLAVQPPFAGSAARSAVGAHPSGVAGAAGGRFGARWQSGDSDPKKEEQEQEKKEDKEGGEEDPLKAEVAKLQEENKELKHRMLTAMADVENMRSRMQAKSEEDRKFAARSFAKGMLEVADVLDKALESVPLEKREGNPELAAIYEGMEATSRLFQKGLEAQNVKKFDPTDEKFDPTMHDAKFEMPAGDGEKGMVKACIKVGYMIHDRCLRPAEVGVTK